MFMYICLCKGITEKQLMDELNKANTSEQDVLRRMGIGDGCGICLIDAIQTIKRERDANFNHQKPCSSDSNTF